MGIILNLKAMDEGGPPQVQTGWGTGAPTNINSEVTIGMPKKQNYWDNKTTELVIPEMGDEFGETTDNSVPIIIAEPPTIETKMMSLQDLNKAFAINVPTSTDEGVDISLLTSCIRPIQDLIETDMHWDYVSLQAEIGQNFRERYGKGEIEGTRA